MLLEAFAYIADLLLFYLDRQGNETYLPTATERQNLINMCKLIGYAPAGARAASATVRISIENPHESDVALPAGSQLGTREDVLFETTEDAVIKTGELFTEVTAVEGETFEDIIGVSDGEPNQEFYLPRSGVIEIKSISAAGHLWERADSVADHLPEERIYMAELDAWGRARITFGNGHSGQIPEEDENITAVYRIGGGISGNVAPNTITAVRDVAFDSDGNRVNVNVTNPDWASGGSEPESLENIKFWAPKFFEAQNRCVTQRDYEAHAMAYNGIAKARATVRERSGEANVIRYYVLTYGQDRNSIAHAPQILKDGLLAYLDRYKMLTDWIEVEDGKWREINFSGTITIEQGFSSGSILNSVKDVLTTLLNIETRDMGEPLRISDVYAAIDNIEGVLHVELDEPDATVEAEFNELLVIGNIDFQFSVEGVGLTGENI